MVDVVEVAGAGAEFGEARRDATAEVSATGACGVPEIVTEAPVSPLAFEVSPAGRPVTVHLNGALPPLTLIVHV
jgi:hypothetical protein